MFLSINNWFVSLIEHANFLFAQVFMLFIVAFITTAALFWQFCKQNMETMRLVYGGFSHSYHSPDNQRSVALLCPV